MSRAVRPAVVRVGPLDWLVVYDATTLTSARRQTGEETLGFCCKAELTITLDPKLPDQQVAATLLHEVLHACVFAAGIEFKDEDEEERVVNQLGLVLFGVIRDNPELLRYLRP